MTLADARHAKTLVEHQLAIVRQRNLAAWVALLFHMRLDQCIQSLQWLCAQSGFVQGGSGQGVGHGNLMSMFQGFTNFKVKRSLSPMAWYFARSWSFRR